MPVTVLEPKGPTLIPILFFGTFLYETKNRKTKFKLRCPRYVYTLKVDDEKKAEKIKTSIPKDIEKHDINEKKGKKKEQKKK